MKKVFRYTALVCASAAVAISCVEENLEPVIPAVDGDAIVFGVRAGFEDSAPGTKTEYSGQDYTDDNGTRFERIDWVNNDKIEIYSPDAENPLATDERPHSTHYVVTKVSSGNGHNHEHDTQKKDYAQLSNLGEAGLRWNGTDDHHFYAMYPSSEMFRQENGDIPANIRKGIFMGLDNNSDVTVYGVVPGVQQPTVTTTDNINYVAKPDMNYAYMVAKTTVDPTENNQVYLSFVPIVTAVEIELVNVDQEKDIVIKEIEITSDKPITGEFTANLSDWDPTKTTYPTCTNLTTETGSTNAIQISPRVNVGGNYEGVPVVAGGSLKFTVFLLPGATIENLEIKLSSDGMGYTSKTLTGANIPAKLKTRIIGLNLPKENEFNAGGDDWMSQLDPQSQIRYLSLPGTGGSFTSEANDNFKQQTLDFDAQWSLGVRAFELSSDRPSSGTTSLGGERITCNKVDVTDASGNYITVISAIRSILHKLTDFPTETAALILTYQPEDNNPNRNATDYARSLYTMLTGNGTTGQGNTLSSVEVDKIIPYTQTLTLDTSKGKLILICRPNQNDETDNGSFATAQSSGYLPIAKVTAINGCGTAKDRWGARGYKINKYSQYFWSKSWNSGFFGMGAGWRSPVYSGEFENLSGEYAMDISNNANNFILSETSGQNQTGYAAIGGYVEYYMNGQDKSIFEDSNVYSTTGDYGETLSVTRPDPSDPEELNFAFETNIEGTICWFQEWARVIPSDTHHSETWTDGYSSGDYDIYWFESLDEKLDNIKTTFDMAINNYNSNYIYINSLCGYLATTETAVSPTWSLAPSMPVGNSSIWGGAGGNIKALSDELNPAFYQYISEKGLGVNNSITGPTGIVLMDYVMKKTDANGDTVTGYNYTEDLISAIVANNKKYTPDNILTGGGNGNSNSGTGEGVGGGGSIQPFILR